MRESAEEIMAELSPEDQERFVQTIAGIYLLAGFASMGGNGDEVKAQIDEDLHGRTAEEVFEYAEELADRMQNQ